MYDRYHECYICEKCGNRVPQRCLMFKYNQKFEDKKFCSYKHYLEYLLEKK